MSRLAIVRCGQLVTLAGPDRPRVGPELGELSIITDGAMIVSDGKIEWTGLTDQADLAGCEVIEAHGKVVTPGFVDAHTHLVFAGNRAAEFEMRAVGKSYQQIALEGGGIRSTMRLTRATSEEALVDAAKRHADWFLRCGTTTAEAKSGYGLACADELKILRVIGEVKKQTSLDLIPTFLGAHAIPPEFDEDLDGYLKLVLYEMLPAVAQQGLAQYCDAFCERGYFSIEDCRRVLTRAQELGMGARIHADQLTLGGGAQLAAEINAVTADHLEKTDEIGIAALVEAGVQPVLLPASVYALGHTEYPRARAMIEAGLPVVLATDFNPGSSPTPSMPMVLSLALTHMKMLPSESIVASTVNAAYSLNRGHDRGSLELGKQADFVIWDCRDYRELAVWFGVSLAEAVYVGGRLVA